MYTLTLMDGTNIKHLKRITPNVFERESQTSQMRFQLTPHNLTIAFLSEGDLLADVFVDYALQNFNWDNGIIRFRIGPYNEIYKMTRQEKKYMAQVRRRGE